MIMPQPAHEFAQLAILLFIFFLAAVWFRFRLITNACAIYLSRRQEQQVSQPSTQSLTSIKEQ